MGPPDATPTGSRGRRRLERWAGWSSLGSAAVHAYLAPGHAEEWWGYGLFFGLAALAQVILGLALLTRAVNPKDSGPRWADVRRGLYWLGLGGTLALLAIYAVSRTVGVPFFGPEAGEVEPVEPVDLLAKVLEVAAAVALVQLLRMPKDDAADGSGAPAAPPADG